jgi:hypothetical protein
MRVLIPILAFATTVSADPPPGSVRTAEHQKAGDLVRQLGHPRFAMREAAAKELLEMGPAAFPALAEGAKSPDEEVRNRSQALLPRAKALEWKRRAAAYLADIDGKQKHDLPLLDKWEKLLGKPDSGARELFAEIVRTNGEFLTIAGSTGGTKAVSERCRAIIDQPPVKVPLGDLAALLFAEIVAFDVAASRPWPGTTPSVGQLLSNPGMAEALDAKDLGPAMRRLAVKWAESRPATDQFAVQQFANLVKNKPFPEAAPILLKRAKDAKANPLTIRVPAIQALGAVGTKEAADALAELVTDKTQVYRSDLGDEPLIGDIALAAVLPVHGKKPDDYGLSPEFGITFANGNGDPDIQIELRIFRSRETREKALAKWKTEVVQKARDKKK